MIPSTFLPARRRAGAGNAVVVHVCTVPSSIPVSYLDCRRRCPGCNVFFEAPTHGKKIVLLSVRPEIERGRERERERER